MSRATIAPAGASVAADLDLTPNPARTAPSALNWKFVE